MPSTSSTSRHARRSAEVAAARDRGTKAFAETCPQYLFLSLDDMGNGFEGAKYVCSPPLRTKDHWDDLWTGLVKDDLQLVATDHCPFDFHGQKELGRGDFRKVPNGLPGVEDRVDLLHDGGVVAGRITKERWVEIISTAPAKLFGMYPQKGAVAVGSDADLVVYDPTARGTISARDPPHGRGLLVLRGSRRSRARSESSCRVARSSCVTASSPGARATASSSSAPRPTTPGACPRRPTTSADDLPRRRASWIGSPRSARSYATCAGRATRPPACIDDLVQAVDEAATNVVLHGYDGAAGCDRCRRAAWSMTSSSSRSRTPPRRSIRRPSRA